MTEKETLIKNLIVKSGKSEDELNRLIASKVKEMSGLVSEEGAIYIIANELGLRLDVEKPKRNTEYTKIEDITEPKVPISLQCKVLKKYDKVTFQSKSGSEGSVQSILVGDETGIIRIVFWNEQTEVLEQISENDLIIVNNGYTRENINNERIEINYSQYSEIEVNPEGLEITVGDFKREEIPSTEKKISEIQENDKNVKISALITDFDIPRYYLACPECFKKVMQDDGIQKCVNHGEVKAIKVPIINLVIDDGSGSISVVGFRDRAEEITGLNSDDIVKLSEDIDKYNSFSKKIIGAKLELIGNSSINSMTGENQLLINQISNIEFKDVDEIVADLIKSDNKTKQKTETQEKQQVEKNDIDDLEIEEIDIDDDIL